LSLHVVAQDSLGIAKLQLDFSEDHMHTEFKLLADSSVRDGIKCAVLKEMFEEFDDNGNGHIELNELHDFLAFYYAPLMENYVVDGMVTRERFGDLPRVPLPSEESKKLKPDQYCAYTQAIANYNVFAVWNKNFGDAIQVTHAEFAYGMFSQIDDRFANGLSYNEFQEMMQEYSMYENDSRLYDDFQSKEVQSFEFVNPHHYTWEHVPAHCTRRRLFLCFGICVGIGAAVGLGLEYIGAEAIATTAAAMFDTVVVPGAIRFVGGRVAQEAGAMMIGNVARVAGMNEVAAMGAGRIAGAAAAGGVNAAQALYAPQAFAGAGAAIRAGAQAAMVAGRGAAVLPMPVGGRRLIELEQVDETIKSLDFLKCPAELTFPLDLLN